MKVLIMTNMYPSKYKAYAGIFVKNQYEELLKIVEKEDTLDIFFMRRQQTSKFGSILKYFKATVIFIPKLFKKYDILHLHFLFPLIYLVWAYKKIHPKTKIVVTFHGSDVHTKITEKNKASLRKLVEIVDYTIPVGETLSKQLKEKLLLETNLILPVGVNNNVFYKDCNVDKKYDFIFVGSFTKVKGIDIIIKTIESLNDKTIKFCFCGSGKYLQNLQNLQKKYNITIKKNQTQNQLRTLLNQSKFFLIHSRNEGFPTATLEAMYCGLPIITSDIPQFLEQVNQGVNGYAIPFGNIQKLQEKLIYLKNITDEEYQILQQNALNSFKELSLNNICKKLLNTYKELSTP